MQNDQVQPLNYSGHATEDLRETAVMLQHMMPNSARVLYRLISMLQIRVKLILPNCYNLVEPDEVRQAVESAAGIQWPLEVDDAAPQPNAPVSFFAMLVYGCVCTIAPGRKRIDLRTCSNIFLPSSKDGGTCPLSAGRVGLLYDSSPGTEGNFNL